jgi:hypothetical protein
VPDPAWTSAAALPTVVDVRMVRDDHGVDRLVGELDLSLQAENVDIPYEGGKRGGKKRMEDLQSSRVEIDYYRRKQQHRVSL